MELKRLMSLLIIFLLCLSTILIFTPEAEAASINISLGSRKLDSSTQNLGTITFEPEPPPSPPVPNLPRTVTRDTRPQPYQATFYPPSRHVIHHWEYSGGINVPDAGMPLPLIDVYVNGPDPGTLIAIYVEICDVDLESREDNWATTNRGTITFPHPGTPRSLPTTVSVEQGTKQALYEPAPNYAIDHWETSGDVTVADPYAGELVSVTVNGAGTLRAIYKKVEDDLGITPKLQHKDTNMLCLGGCPFSGDHAWDHEHSDRGCDHDNTYCTMASIQMINAFYGGNLHQDRIRYYYSVELNNNPDSPEGDLAHGEGTDLGDIIAILSWALNDATIDYFAAKPSFAQIKNWIDAGRPIRRSHLWLGSPHATIIDGYEEIGERVHVIDPWDGLENSEPYSTLDVSAVWVPPTSATARLEEDWNSNSIPDTIEDYDLDGLCDFDEIYRFRTYPANVDTDGDLIEDKEEVIMYTFLSNQDFDEHDIREPDPDGDGDRCEEDNDSDNGGTTDGLEDTNRNGFVDPGETDPFDPSDDLLQAANIRVIGHSPINLLVTDPNSLRVGYDPVAQVEVNEIPGATYSGPGSEPQEIIIPNSINGTYEILAIGTDTGSFTITLESLDTSNSVIDCDFWQGTAEPDMQYIETVNLEPDGQLTMSHDIEAAAITSLKTVVCQNYTVQITATIRNQGNYTETSNITLCANDTIIGSIENITIDKDDYRNVNFTWDTNGLPKGNYTLKIYVHPLSEEVDIIDNNLTAGWIIVAMVGDITGPDGWPDGKCDMRDIGFVAVGFGANRVTNKTDPRFGEYWHPIPCGTCPHSPNCDVVYDGKIDMKDIGTVARHFGEIDP